jgi:iron complex outermembrane receptor protein
MMKQWLITTTSVLALIVPAVAGAQTATTPQTATGTIPATTTVPAADTSASSQPEEIIVTGTRQQNRTKQDSPAPVDVISAAELQATGEQNVFDALDKVLPSLDLPPVGFDTAGLVRSARLRGLSPDDVLVLVDGKRRHVSANINADVGPVGGSDPVDLDMIPISLIDHIEVLRDGAAAQYGSDAIAGVINIILKHSDHGGSAYAQEGATYVQDGFTNNLGASFATSIGGNGYFDIAGDYRYHDHTNRDGTFPSEAATGSQLPALGLPVFTVPNKNNISQIEGDPRYNLVNLGYNAGYDLGSTTLYSFGTYGYRHSEAFENYRDPNTSGAYPAAFALYPNGFEPLEALNEDDYSFTFGAKGDLMDGWRYDLSTTYGGDIDNISTIASINPSFYEAFGYSPTHFHAGEFNDTEWTNNLDISKPIDLAFLAAPLSIAFGGEFRRNTYQLQEGDGPSYYGGGAQAYPGFTPASTGYYQRENEAGYIDLATYLLPHWQVDLAGRFEHYSDVKNTETGKLTTRYDIIPELAIRGTISNGFRAPTLAQEGFAAVNVGPTTASGQFPVDSPAARSLGSSPLKPERSQNYEVGIVAEPIPKMHVAFDLYQIDIRDQIVDSGLFSGPSALAALELSGLLPPTCSLGGCNVTAQFFTNGVNTRTQGADLTVDYIQQLAGYGKIAWLAAANFNSTVLTRIAAVDGFTPDVISEIKEDTPKNKIILQGTYSYEQFSLMLRVTRFGQVVEVLADGDSGYTPFTANRNAPAWIGDVEFGYKVTPELTLTVGANNFTDKYANHTTFDSRYHNAVEYIPSSPYGIDGGFYYARAAYKFGTVPPPMPEPPPTLAPSTPPVTPAAPKTYLVFFDWDRADLSERARQIVATAAAGVAQTQTTRIEVNGYTDLSGTKTYNQRLSVRRAETVEAELVRDGVPKNEIAIHGYGESHPLVPTAPGVREPQNRRVEIILM